MIERIEIRNFTVFEDVTVDFVPGVNIFIGDNGTGKTHLLKLLYAVQSAKIEGSFHRDISGKLLRVFLPKGMSLARLIHRAKGKKKEARFVITRNSDKLTCTLTGQGLDIKSGKEYFGETYFAKPVFIPVKEMLANAPGFRSMYATRETHFEEVYSDIIDKAFLPPLKDIEEKQKKILNRLRKAMGGSVNSKNEVFYLRTKSGEIEFTLVAEGMRKLALLWLLIRNGVLDKGATLYWDEPEANLNPSMLPLVVEILLELENIGVQVFIATHSYPLLKEFDLQRVKHSLRFNTLFKDEDEDVKLETAESYKALSPNKIADEYERLYDLQVKQALGGNK